MSDGPEWYMRRSPLPQDADALERLTTYNVADEARILELKDRLAPWIDPNRPRHD